MAYMGELARRARAIGAQHLDAATGVVRMLKAVTGAADKQRPRVPKLEHG